MSEFVERVALAIANAKRAEHDLPPCQWEHLTDEAHAEYALYARAAIEAMHEPTMSMLQDGNYAARKVRPPGISGMTLEAQTQAQCAREAAAWSAMIKASLE